MDTITKLFTGLLLRRLEKWLENHSLLNEFNVGFYRGIQPSIIFSICIVLIALK